jgi:hypothetical protein
LNSPMVSDRVMSGQVSLLYPTRPGSTFQPLSALNQ